MFAQTRILFVVLTSMSISSPSFAKTTNNELKIGISQEFDSLNPILLQMTASTYINYMINRRMTNLDRNSKWVPQIVKEIPTLENGQAKITI